MSIRSGFFNYELVESEPDRTYSAEDWATLFGILYSSGVISKYLNKLEVIQNTPAAMNVLVKSGAAIANGYWLINTADKIITVEAPNATLARIDAIIVKFDIATDRIGSIIYRKGTADANPAAPALVNTSSVFEFCLATISVPVGTANIVTNNITDKRSDETLCGYSKTFSDIQYDEIIASYEENLADVMGIFEEDGKIKPERLFSKILDVADSKTLALTDAGLVLNCTKATAMTITVPSAETVNFPIGTEIEIYQKGAGVVTITHDVAVAFEIKNKVNPGNAVIDARYGWVGLKKMASNVWSVRGDIA